MATRAEHARVWLFFASLSAPSVAAFACFWSIVWRVRIELGHWPSFNDPDPSTLNDHVHDALFFALLLFAFVSPWALACGLVLWRALLRAWQSSILGLLVFAGIHGAFRAWERADPGSFLGWYFD